MQYYLAMDLFAMALITVGILVLFSFFFAAWNEGLENDKFKVRTGYNKNRRGEIKNVCRECGKVWFYDQRKINDLVDKTIATRHATNVSAPMAMGSNWASGRGNTVLNQSVLQSAQLAGMSAQTTEAQIEALRQCPDCNSNNVKRTAASSRASKYRPEEYWVCDGCSKEFKSKFETRKHEKNCQQYSRKSNDSIDIEAKLKKAKNLYEKKLIDESDYKQMKTKLLKNMDFDEPLDVEIVDETPNTQRFHCKACNFKAVLGDGSTHCPNCYAIFASSK